jgi:molybdopterin-guanine dinucleotide biosynthesis protein A
MAARSAALGVILAGGLNRRYGSHKAFETVGGVRIIDRVITPLRASTARVAIVANEPRLYTPLGWPVRADHIPGAGPLGGIHAAVRWAVDEGFEVALVVACDMPFLPEALLRQLVSACAAGIAVVPASDGPRGLEPLCAAYGTGCLPAIESALAREDRAVISFFQDVEVRVLDLESVREHGQPSHIFLNVNRMNDRLRAEKRLADR